MREPAISTRKVSSGTPYGCLTLLSVLLLGGAYMIFSPDTPSSGAFLVDAHERTYLETEPFIHGEGFLDPQSYWTLDVTYLQLGGWFESTKRLNWGRIATSTSAGTPSQAIPPVTFTRLPVGEDSVVRISMTCASCQVGEVFVKPKTFPGSAADPPAVAAPVAAPPVDNKVYAYVEHMPGIAGIEGLTTVAATIERRLVLPAQAPHGRVLVRFIVTKQGAVQQVQLVQGVGAPTDAAVLVAVRHLPRFVPGMQYGQPLNVSLTVSVAVGKEFQQ